MSQRLDVTLVERGLFQSRAKAKHALDDKIIYVNNQQTTKASLMVEPEDHIEIRGQVLAYVSRGGLKLEKAIKLYGLDLSHKICMDIGASTGGFTDCMLQNEASLVYAVDVGSDQLDGKLKNQKQVIDMSPINVRELDIDTFDSLMDFISIDVSFIPLKLVLPKAYDLLKLKGEMVFLIKPQFEIGKHKGLKKGIVKDKKLHQMVIRDILSEIGQLGFSLLGLTYSPIKGPKGNIEFLAYVKKGYTEDGVHMDADEIKSLIAEAHAQTK